MINFFKSIVVLNILLISNSFSLEKLNPNQKIRKTEQLLVETANKISEGKIEAALSSVKSLININPNFRSRM